MIQSLSFTAALLLASAAALVWLLLRAYRTLATGTLTISELYIHPVKSCGGLKVTEAKVLRSGLQWDREFAIVNGDGEVLSQKTHPRLANIWPVLHCTEPGPCLLYTSPSPRDATLSRMPSSA